MREADIIQLLQILDLKRIKGKDNWVVASCPFAPKRHKKGSDNSPSFGISVHQNKESHYNCLACHSHGYLTHLPTELARELGMDVSKAREFIIQNEIIGLPDYESPEEDGFESDYAPEIPKVAFEKFDRVKEWMYNNRGITPATAKKFGFMHDSYEERLIIPIRDSSQRLVGMRGRYLGSDTTTIRYRAYTELSASGSDPKRFGVWFGDHLPLNRQKVLTLVEGEMDLILLWQSGAVSNIRASMGSQITRMQARKICDLNMPVLFFFDNDMAGTSAMKTMIEKLRGFVPMYRVTNYYGKKDPAEIVNAGLIKKALNLVTKIA